MTSEESTGDGTCRTITPCAPPQGDEIRNENLVSALLSMYRAISSVRQAMNSVPEVHRGPLNTCLASLECEADRLHSMIINSTKIPEREQTCASSSSNPSCGNMMTVEDGPVVYRNLDNLRTHLQSISTSIRAGIKPASMECDTVDPSSADDIVRLEQALTLNHDGQSVFMEKISDDLLGQYLTLIAQQGLSLSSFYAAMMMINRGECQTPGENTRIRKVPSRFMNVLRTLISAKILKIESMRMAPPDYDHPVVVKKYSQQGMNEFVAPDNGYLIGSGHVSGVWLKACMNGRELTTGAGEGLGYFPHGHMPIYLPMGKGQRFKLTTGDYHALNFYPCLRY